MPGNRAISPNPACSARARFGSTDAKRYRSARTVAENREGAEQRDGAHRSCSPWIRALRPRLPVRRFASVLDADPV